MTAVDVTLRNLATTVVPGGAEIIGLITVLIVLAAVANVELDRKHIQVDLILNLVSTRNRRAMIAAGLILTLAVMATTAVQMFAQSDYLMRNHIVTARLGLPHWPFVGAAAAYVLLFALALVANLAKDLAAVLRDGGLWIVLIGAFVATIIVTFVFNPELLPYEASRPVKGLLCILLCFSLIFLGVHVATGMAVTALLGIALLISPSASLTSLGTASIAVVGDPLWSVIPLFTWMGLIVVASGFAQDLYRAAYRWIGHLPGGLASASTVACAGLSSIVGDTLSGVYSMGSIALPQMKQYGYDMKLATASIACAATIGVLIPPSIAFIVEC
ncbi:MAG: TRAP transporter large permease subunit [Sulfitobacter sp.]